MRQNEEFIEAYDVHADAIFRYCYFRVFDKEKASDLVQEVFMRTWEYQLDGNEVQNMRALLYKIARNLIIDDSRKRKTLSLDQLSEQGFDPSVSELETIQTNLDAQALTALMQKLDPIYREAVTMRYIEGYAPKEIAEVLGESENLQAADNYKITVISHGSGAGTLSDQSDAEFTIQ